MRLHARHYHRFSQATVGLSLAGTAASAVAMTVSFARGQTMATTLVDSGSTYAGIDAQRDARKRL